METEKSTLTPSPLQPLTIADRRWFEKLLLAHPMGAQPLAAHSFAYHYIWRDLFCYEWLEMEGHICLFSTNADGTFLALPPVGPAAGGPVMRRVFSLLAERNSAPGVSRIENVPADLAEQCRSLGYRVLTKPGDYVYRCADLVALTGDRYKSQRASYNHCVKHSAPIVRPYKPADMPACLRLFQSWQHDLETRSPTGYACALAADSASAHHAALSDADELGLVGLVGEIGGQVAAYSLGYTLSDSVFCVLLEIADREVSGLSQYIFREFCRRLSRFEFINAMDDSGLEGLRRAKESYHPEKILPSCIVTEAGGESGGLA